MYWKCHGGAKKGGRLGEERRGDNCGGGLGAKELGARPGRQVLGAKPGRLGAGRPCAAPPSLFRWFVVLGRIPFTPSNLSWALEILGLTHHLPPNTPCTREPRKMGYYLESLDFW